MFIDAGTIGEGERVEADLCIIGAGPAGITIAREFAGRDVRVCLLDSGGFSSSIRTHRLTAGPSVGDSCHRLLLSRDRAFGGTSLRWPLDEGWHARPFDPIDFEVRPGVPHSGWPISYDDVATYYPRAQEIGDLGPFTYDPADWESSRGLPLGLGEDIETTVFQLGTTDFRRFRDEFARVANIRTILRATVVDIATDSDAATVDRVEVARPDGRRFSVVARDFVLAAGGIDNPRLLLASHRSHPRGIGNHRDLVGRYFMERLSARAGFVDPSSQQVIKDAELYVSKPVGHIRIEGALRLRDEVIRASSLRNCIVFVLPRSRAFVAEGVRSAGTLVKGLRRRPAPIGVGGHIRNVARDWRSVITVVQERLGNRPVGEQVLLLRVQGEQSPNPVSRVTLDRRRDHLGMPRARLEWRVAEDDLESLRRTERMIGEAFRRAGLGTPRLLLGDEDPPALIEGNHHHMGTTRMAADDRHGVVDPDGRVFGMTNLFVAGSSVFPTAGSSNPTLTIIALALRLADHLHRRLHSPGAVVPPALSIGGVATQSDLTDYGP